MKPKTDPEKENISLRAKLVEAELMAVRVIGILGVIRDEIESDPDEVSYQHVDQYATDGIEILLTFLEGETYGK